MHQSGWGGEEVLSTTHVTAAILVILDSSCVFVTMATDSAQNLVFWALESDTGTMWCQFWPLGALLSVCLHSSCLSPFVSVSVSPQPALGPSVFFVQEGAAPAPRGDTGATVL